MKNKISVVLIGFFVLFTILISGCTSINSGLTDNTPVATTVASIAASTENPTTTATDVKSSSQSEDAKPPVSWKDFYPDYDEQAKQEMIEDAKDEIVRVFSDVERSKLAGEWVDNRYTSKYSGSYGFPVIIFENVDDTSDKYLEVHGSQNIAEIIVDPIKNEIINYKPAGYTTPRTGVEKSLTLDEGLQRSINLVNDIKGYHFVDENNDNMIVDKRDSDDMYRGGLVTLSIINKYKGIPYFSGGILVLYDSYADIVSQYGDSMTDQDFLHELTNLSPEPDITIDEAKEILIKKLTEEYPGEDLSINFVPVDTVRYGDSLVWFDDRSYVYADNPESVPLTWYLQFTDKEMREENKDISIGKKAFIDAHTGEIVSLVYRDLRIPAEKF